MNDMGPPRLDDPVVQRRLLLHIRYEGPFERVMNWLWCLDPVTNEILREVPEGSPRNWLACRAEALDRAWREWYVRRRRMPSGRWRRKPPPPLDDDDDRENPVNPWSSYGRDVSW